MTGLKLIRTLELWGRIQTPNWGFAFGPHWDFRHPAHDSTQTW